jgi:hypothetical protein
VIDDERPWPDYPILSWFRLALMKYRSEVIGGEDSDYPPQFLKAVEEYADKKKKYIFKAELWTAHQKWKDYIKAHPEFLPASQPVVELLRGLWPPWPNKRKEAEDFQNLVLNALFSGDRELLQLLIEVATSKDAPKSGMDGIGAVIAAFHECCPCTPSEADPEDEDPSDDWPTWPTKKELHAATNDILIEAGLPPLSDRQFTRILNDNLWLGEALRHDKPAKPQPKRARRRRIG